ncbi:MAG: helix-turn-helix transcriptional regulator [Brumimicrobium sp.]
MKSFEYEKEIKRLGEKVKELRLQQNITQEILSALCDVDVRTIQRIEKGQQNITLRILFRISDSLSVNPAELIKLCIQE